MENLKTKASISLDDYTVEVELSSDSCEFASVDGKIGSIYLFRDDSFLLVPDMGSNQKNFKAKYSALFEYATDVLNRQPFHTSWAGSFKVDGSYAAILSTLVPEKVFNGIYDSGQIQNDRPMKKKMSLDDYSMTFILKAKEDSDKKVLGEVVLGVDDRMTFKVDESYDISRTGHIEGEMIHTFCTEFKLGNLALSKKTLHSPDSYEKVLKEIVSSIAVDGIIEVAKNKSENRTI